MIMELQYIYNALISSSCKPVAFEVSGVNVAISSYSLSSIPFIPQNLFLLQKYNFYMKSANKSSDFLRIKIYLLLLQWNYQIKYLYMSKEKQETGYVYILTNPSFRED